MILIVGDSFSADSDGWPMLLNNDIVNISQKGIGQYKIYKNFKESNYDFDKVIFCHTSPWRINTKYHPIHSKSKDRPQNDFILSDIEYHSKNNAEIKLAKNYINKFYDFEYARDTYDLMVNDLLKISNSIHITFHDPEDTKLIKINFNKIWKNNQGNLNHMTNLGNALVAQELIKLL